MAKSSQSQSKSKNNKAEDSVEEKTLKELRILNKEMSQFNSRKQVFIRGIYRGVGVAVGATVIAAIALSILSFLLTQAEDVPVIENIIDAFNLNESIENR